MNTKPNQSSVSLEILGMSSNAEKFKQIQIKRQMIAALQEIRMHNVLRQQHSSANKASASTTDNATTDNAITNGSAEDGSVTVDMALIDLKASELEGSQHSQPSKELNTAALAVMHGW
jgi:hypothetical protein